MALLLVCPAGARAQTGAGQPEFVTQGQRLLREGKPEDAEALYRTVLKTAPDSMTANNAMGVLLDLTGRGREAREYFQKAIDTAGNGQAKSTAQRAMAMSWAFEGNCGKTVEYESAVFQYYVTTKDFEQQGAIADEAGRVCIETGDYDTAYQWYLTGHQAALKQPDLGTEAKNLWNFRWEHAQARIAARRGNQTEANAHVAAAREILMSDEATRKTQEPFLSGLAGYVAFYRGDYDQAVRELRQGTAGDPSVECLLGQAYGKLGQSGAALEWYRKAAATTAHNPPAAYARPYASKKLAGK